MIPPERTLSTSNATTTHGLTPDSCGRELETPQGPDNRRDVDSCGCQQETRSDPDNRSDGNASDLELETQSDPDSRTDVDFSGREAETKPESDNRLEYLNGLNPAASVSRSPWIP